MPFTVTKDLNALHPVRNEVLYGARSDVYNTSAGTAMSMQLIFNNSDIPVNNDSFRIQLLGNDFYLPVFTFKTTVPDATAYKCIITYAASGSVDVQAWIEDHVLPKLRGSYLLYNWFEMEYTSSGAHHGVLFTAREVGTHIGVTDVLETGFAWQTQSIVDGVDAVTEANFSLPAQLWVEEVQGSDEFVLAVEDEYPPDTQGGAEMEVAEVLRDYLAPMLPTAGLSAPMALVDCWRRFFVRFVEKFSTPPIAGGATQDSDICHAYLAGMKEVDRVNYPDWADFIIPGDQCNFLTAWPNTELAHAKKVMLDQEEYLAFIVPHIGSNDLKVKANLFFTDGTSNLNQTLHDIVAPEFGQMYVVPVGIERTGLHLVDPTRTIANYRVRVTLASGSTISEVRFFEYDPAHRQRARQLHFFNSQGGTDTLVLYGERSNKPEVDMQESDRSTRGSTTLEEARATVRRLRTMSDAFEAGTAYLLPAEVEAVKDLVASERIVELVGDEHWPVRALTTKGPPSDEADGLLSFAFKYRYDLNNTAQS